MSDNPFIKLLINSTKNFIKRYPKISISIGGLCVFAGILIFIPQIRDGIEVFMDLFSSRIKSEKELTIEWLEENFTDSTFNVLIFPFNDYTEDTTKKIKIEKAINDRLDEYRRKELYSSESKSKIKIKFFEEVDPTINPDSLEKIAKTYKTDIMIYGNIYDEPKTATINYFILSESDKWQIFGREGALKGIAFNSVYEFREGPIIKDLDYLTYWLFCNELLFDKNIIALYDTWNSLKRIFKESMFFTSNAFLTAIIGENFHKTKDYLHAKEFYNLSIYYRQSSQVYNNLGLIFKQQSLTDSAEVCYSIAIALDSSNFNSYNNMGVLYMEKLHLYVKAKNWFDKAIELDSTNVNANFNLGLLYGRYLLSPDSAKNYFLAALENVKHIPLKKYAIFKSIGNSYCDFNFDTARYYYNKALQINSKESTIYYDLGILFRDYDEFDSAKHYYLKAIQINPNYDNAHNSLGLLYKNKLSNTNAALYHLKKASIINPNESGYYYNIGLLYDHQILNLDSALICYKRAIEVNPKYEAAYFALADLYLTKIENFDSARAYYEKIVNINPKNASAHNNLAVLLYSNFSEYKLSSNHFETAIKLNPLLGEAYINYAQLLATRLNNKKKAKEYYLKAIKIDEKFRDDRFEESLNNND